jgi:hypothetical protein
MKKISSLIVCLVLLAGGTAFALDLPDALKIPGLTVTGDVRTGLRVAGGTIDDVGKNGQFANGKETGAQDPIVYAYSDDIGDGSPFRAQLQLVWERDNLGVKTRFRYRPDSGPVNSTITPTEDETGTPDGNFSGTPAKPDGRLSGTLNNLNNTINKAFVYAYLWDKKIKVSAGKALDGAWGLFYSNFSSGSTGDFDGKDGIKVEVKPIDGLNVGAFYGTGDLFANAYKNAPAWSDNNAEDRRLVVGAKYETGLFKVVAATTHNFVEVNKGLNSYTATGGFYAVDPVETIDKPIPSTSNLLIGLQVTPIDPLKIDLSMAAVGLGTLKVKDAYADGEDMAGTYKKGDFNPYWGFYPKLAVNYAVSDQLGVTLEIGDLTFADDYYYKEAGNDDREDDGVGNLFAITVSPSASYAISDTLSAGLQLSFKVNANGTDQFGFGIKPSFEFSLGSGAKFVVYDELVLYSKSKDEDHLGTDISDWYEKHPELFTHGPLSGASGTTNALQFDFVWSF